MKSVKRRQQRAWAGKPQTWISPTIPATTVYQPTVAHPGIGLTNVNSSGSLFESLFEASPPPPPASTSGAFSKFKAISPEQVERGRRAVLQERFARLSEVFGWCACGMPMRDINEQKCRVCWLVDFRSEWIIDAASPGSGGTHHRGYKCLRQERIVTWERRRVSRRVTPAWWFSTKVRWLD